MKLTFKAGIATTALAVAACFAAPAGAADLRDIFSRGSDNGGFKSFARHSGGGVGNCYMRADVGYSFSRDPEANWPVNNITRNYDNDTNGDTVIDENDAITSETTTFVGDAVSGASFDNTWFGEAGFGCGSGSNGFRAEVMMGVHADRDFDGKPQDFAVTNVFATLPQPPLAPQDDPLHTSLRTYTMMLNVYKDFGNHGGFTPYVGAGIGVAYHKLSEVYFTGNPNLTNRIRGNSDLSFAWSLMAGVGYQMSERAILDVGYRFIDMGSIGSDRADSAGFVNPAVEIDDIRAHEIKVGVRYHFGGHDEEESFK